MLVATLVASLSLGPAPGTAKVNAAPASAHPIVAIETELGTIRVELDPEHAPATVANFLRYVDEHFFQETAFYRTVTLTNQPNNPIKIQGVKGISPPWPSRRRANRYSLPGAGVASANGT